MRTSAYIATLLLALFPFSVSAQYSVSPVEEVSCVGVSEDRQFIQDSVVRVELTLTGGDSLVLTWDPAIVIGAIGMEDEGGMDIWWVEGSLETPITVGSDPPGAVDSERLSRSALRPGTRFRVMVMDAAKEDEVTWVCTRVYVVEG